MPSMGVSWTAEVSSSWDARGEHILDCTNPGRIIERLAKRRAVSSAAPHESRDQCVEARCFLDRDDSGRGTINP